ncbi:hypothetical protein ASE94_01695 [Devosia sp. Leaf64]|nr:hypothetical protein ASE94_01695 [Devosia sp. Leaf64]
MPESYDQHSHDDGPRHFLALGKNQPVLWADFLLYPNDDLLNLDGLPCRMCPTSATDQNANIRSIVQACTVFEIIIVGRILLRPLLAILMLLPDGRKLVD